MEYLARHDLPAPPRLGVLAPSASRLGGCNRLTGGWGRQTDTALSGELAAARMRCVEVDDRLSGAEPLIVDGDLLRAYGSGGEELGTVPRR